MAGNTFQEWTKKYWEFWMKIFVQKYKYIKNWESIEILHR